MLKVICDECNKEIKEDANAFLCPCCFKILCEACEIKLRIKFYRNA